MGNCQAVDTTRIVIQHPNGKEEMLSCPVSASYVMKMNLGHCVALLISTTALSASPGHGGPLRLTRIKLLRPTETLVLGHVYRLITTKGTLQTISCCIRFHIQLHLIVVVELCSSLNSNIKKRLGVLDIYVTLF